MRICICIAPKIGSASAFSIEISSPRERFPRPLRKKLLVARHRVVGSHAFFSRFANWLYTKRPLLLAKAFFKEGVLTQNYSFSV